MILYHPLIAEHPAWNVQNKTRDEKTKRKQSDCII